MVKTKTAMKTTGIKIFMAIIGIIITIARCSQDPEFGRDMALSIKLLGEPQCKGLKSAFTIHDIPSDQSCIGYSYNPELHVLELKHQNAGFNCCPESLWCTVIFRNDTIIIQEYEKHLGCKCNCLYNLDMEVDGVPPGKYWLRIVEPYLGEQQPLVGLLDLQSQKQGSFCGSRSIYPWGE